MKDDERDPGSEGEIPDGDQDVRELLSAAGRRPAVPQDDLDAVTTAARAAWRSGLAKRHAQGGGTRARRVLYAALGLAAALALVAGLAWWWTARSAGPPRSLAWAEAVAGSVRIETEPGASPVRLVAGAAIPHGATLSSASTPLAGRAALRLTSGASVRLDAGSRVRCLSAALLELQNGALYVDTGDVPPAERARRSITVQTPLGVVREVGTRFAVRLVGRPGSDASALLVRVRDGAVRTGHQGRSEVTTAGEEVELHRDGTADRRSIAAYGASWDWVLAAAAGFPIEGRTLGELLDWVARETGWQIVFADPGLADAAPRIVLHGSLGTLRADKAPFAILPGAGLAGELTDGKLVIRRLRAPR